VALSINLSRILGFRGLSGRAAEALGLLIGVLLVGSFGLVPEQSAFTFGGEILAVGVVLWLSTTLLHILQIRWKHPWKFLGYRMVLTQCATLSFCASGLEIMRSNHRGLHWLVVGCIFSFLASLTTAWVLLVEIVR
jgi:hypothetical protein